MKTQIAAAIALSLVAGVTFAAPTFYGEIDVTADYLPEQRIMHRITVVNDARVNDR